MRVDLFALLWGQHGGARRWIRPWLVHRLVWAIPAVLLLGYTLGDGVGRLAMWLRSRHRDPAANDFLSSALIALAYVGAEPLAA